MDNNGGQNTGYAGSGFVQNSGAPRAAKKISGIAVVLMIVFLVVGFGGGTVVGGLIAGGTGTVEEDGKETADATPVVTPTSVDTTMQDELDKKIDAYQVSKAWGATIRPFHVSYLSAQDKLYAVFNFMKDDQLKGLVDAMNNSSYPYETTVSAETVKNTYETFFGEELSESEMISFSQCGLSGGITGTFEYDSANGQYRASLPEAPGCGGMALETRFAYKDSYTVEGNKAYVTVEVGRSYGVATDPNLPGIYSDFEGGVKLYELESAPNPVIDESNKDSFTKYQYVFEKQESGAWALKGLYPAEK